MKHFCALYEDLKIVQISRVIDEELKTLIEDTRKFMKEDFENVEIKQQVIGMLFLMFSIKVFKGSEFRGNKQAA